MRGIAGFRVSAAGVILGAGALSLSCQQDLPVQKPDQNSPTNAEHPAATPGEIYKAAMRPLEIVRSSLDNWSEAELGALAVGIRKANDACEASRREDYAGDDLYDLARLCALGQNWERANGAAQGYIASKLDPHRAQAYALAINAMVHMNAIDLALDTTREMLRVLPYDAELAYAVRYMKDDLEQSSNPEALKLASEEHEAIVGALKQHAALKAVTGDAVMSVGALYESAMVLAFWQRYAGDDAAASATAADADQAVAAGAPALSAEDAARIAAVRLRYGLVGARLPEVRALRALESPSVKAGVIRADAPLTVLVVFPDWCGGCRKMMKPLTEFVKANKETPIRAYGLVFEDDSVIPLQAAHEELLKEMKGTSTLVVPAATAQMLGANDYPLGIIIDVQSKVRFIGVLPGDAFNGDGYVEKTILKIAAAEPGLGIKMDSKRK